ncbi:hypothetical protein QOZ80_3AG0218170 [Eleusine coracana subsp. coracana]|nr:hypothetical protein QOZ80_3AG0218170 [Eleusine coracana subsp. coracana]
MAPSASMLFLGYHQLHGPAAEAPRKEEASPLDGSSVRFSLGSVFSLAAFARRPEGKVVGCKRDAVEEKPAAAAAAELDEKFEEALRLSCWSS